MAKYEITYACGHTTVMQLYDKYEDRHRKIDYYKTAKCPSCQAQQLQTADATAGLPRLTGSDKQIVWASEIRKRFVAVAKTLRTRIDASGNSDKPQVVEVLDKINQVLDETRAGWWINNKEDLYSVDTFLRNYQTL